MKKKFVVEIEDSAAKEAVKHSDLFNCLTSKQFLSPLVAIYIKDSESEEDNSREEKIYDRLLEKIRLETDPENLEYMTGALRNFCDAMETRRMMV